MASPDSRNAVRTDSAAVTSIRAQNNGAEIAVTVTWEGNAGERQSRVYVILTEQYAVIRPVKGSISDAGLSALESASRLRGAIREGERLLSYAPSTVRNLTRKLRSRGFAQDEAESAAERLKEIGLIDEENDLEREVAVCLRKLWGERRIRTHLWSRGYSHDVLEELPELLAEVDFADNCAVLTRKRYGKVPRDPGERRKLCAALARYGYSPEEIREAFRILMRNENEG